VSVIGRIRLPRPTIRLRLTLLYGVLFLASGAALLAVTYVLVASATSDPLVYRDPNGQLTVTLSGGGEVGPVATDEASTVVTEGSSGGPAPVGPDDDEIQALAEAQHAAQMGQLLTWSGVALAIMAVASVGIGWLVAGRVLDPMRRLTADVRQISTTNLHERLALHGPDDELKELGGTFNDLLGRLERSFEAQRQLVANASHELRTPLARQRTLLQVALADPELTADSLRATAERVLAAGDQQEELIDALIALARGERGLDHHEPVDLAPVTGDVIRAKRADAESRGLVLETRLGSAPLSGDRRLIERLAANLIDNAARYNRPGGRVEAMTGVEGGHAILRVANDGPQVADAEVDRLFQPFRRLGADRLGHGESWGLGLSIVRAIAHAHGGQVTAAARPEGGLLLEVLFPVPSRASSARS
jgi:signal transduction histidine kinase